MPIGEFDLIAKFFTRSVTRAALGVGDDCALFATSPGMQLAVSSDMLVEGRHFLPTVLPQRLGHKALAVNLSDLAACGAKPMAFTLALALPRVDEVFLDGFARGLLALADAHGCELVGGDTVDRKCRPSTSMSLLTASCMPGAGCSSAQSSPTPSTARFTGRVKYLWMRSNSPRASMSQALSAGMAA